MTTQFEMYPDEEPAEQLGTCLWRGVKMPLFIRPSSATLEATVEIWPDQELLRLVGDDQGATTGREVPPRDGRTHNPHMPVEFHNPLPDLISCAGVLLFLVLLLAAVVEMIGSLLAGLRIGT